MVRVMSEEKNKMNKEKKGHHKYNQEIFLWLNLEEITIESYLKEYGHQLLSKDSVVAAAKRIGIVTINHGVLKPDYLKPKARLLLILFDGEKIFSLLEKVIVSGTFSIIARVEESDSGILILSIDNGKVLATLELAEKNTMYLLRYDPLSTCHYLFEVPMDIIKRLNDGPILMPLEKP